MVRELLLTNTLTREKDTVDGTPPVGLYVCGITPYDATHLGHAFTYTVFDVLTRYLRFMGRDVVYVQNVTDVDDDILLRAKSNGVNWKELGDRELERYLDDMRVLNNLPPDVMPRATEHIDEMIGIAQGLLEKGLAYQREGHVYFEVKKDPEFGKLCRAPYEAQLQLANERGNFPDDPLKKDPLDFVLWQPKKDREPSWRSPWGEGRPGWHIECSAMGMRYLGETFAIHGGGEDLMFPHHECEIAQSENFTGKKPFVRHWVHVGMVYCDERKMSKSLGNMVFVADLLREHVPDAIRLHLLRHHYRHSWNFEVEELAEMNDLARRLAGAALGADPAGEDDLVRWGSPILDAVGDDLNTPLAIGALTELAERRDPSARRVLRTLGSQVLGLTFRVD